MVAAAAAHAQSDDGPDLGRTEALVRQLTNRFRADEGRAAVKVNAKLDKAARNFAEFMARTGKYGHTADGKEPSERAAEHGYDYCLVSENIAWQFSSGGFATADLARRF